MENRLLHLMSIDRKVIEIPGVIMKRHYSDLMMKKGVTKKDADIRAKEYQLTFRTRQKKIKATELDMSPLSFGLYNATIDTGSPINIRTVFDTVKHIGLIHSDDITVTECKFKYGRFQTAVTFSGDYPMSGDASKPFVSANFKARDSNGKGISFDFYKTGKVRFSGTFDPVKVRAFFSKYYPITGRTQMNNHVVSFRIGMKPDIQLIHDGFSMGVSGRFHDWDIKTQYLTKKVKAKTTSLPSSFLYVTFTKDAETFSAIVTTSGTVQIQGTTHYEKAYRVLKQFFVALKDNIMLGDDTIKQKVRVAPVHLTGVPAPEVTRRGTTCPIDRRPEPYGYMGKCAKGDCYVKPNPQGQPCCYGIPKSL